MTDYIVEPIRSKLIPGYFEVKDAAVNAGALGCSISGSGPSIFALCKDRSIAKNVISRMESVLKDMATQDIGDFAQQAFGINIYENNKGSILRTIILHREYLPYYQRHHNFPFSCQ